MFSTAIYAVQQLSWGQRGFLVLIALYTCSDLLWVLLYSQSLYLVLGDYPPTFFGTLGYYLLDIRLSLYDALLGSTRRVMWLTRHYTLLLLVVFSLVVGIRKIRKPSSSRSGVYLVLLGSILALLSAARPISFFALMSRKIVVTEAHAKESIAHLHETLESNPGRGDASQRAFLWKAYAESVFLESGEIVEIEDESGRTVLFEPTEENRKRRTWLQETRAEMKPPIIPTVMWLVVGAISALVGLLTPVRQGNGIVATTT